MPHTHAKAKFFALSTAALLGTAMQSSGQLPSALPNTTENIHLGMSFNEQIANPAALAGKIDYVWGASRNVPGAYQDAYVPYDQDEFGATISNPKAIQPSWMVYACDQKTPAYEWGDPTLVLDPAYGPAHNYQISEAQNTIAGQYEPGTTYNGIAFDSITLVNDTSRCGSWRNGSWVPLYGGAASQNDPLFVTAVVNWAQSMYSWFKSAYPAKGFALNLNAARSADPQHPFQNIGLLYPYMDIDVSEQGFTGYGQNYYGYGYNVLADGDWQNTVNSFETLNSQGKAFYVVNLISASSEAAITRAQLNWVIANYLLVKGAHSYMSMYHYWNGQRPYGNFYDRPEYHITIGHATSGRYTYQGVQRRDYSHGMVLVNPSSTQSYAVTIPSGYTNMYGSAVTSRTLTPTTALVLLHS